MKLFKTAVSILLGLGIGIGLGSSARHFPSRAVSGAYSLLPDQQRPDDYPARIECQVIRHLEKTYTLLSLKKSGTPKPYYEHELDITYNMLLPDSSRWVFDQYRATIARERVDSHGRAIAPIEEGYLFDLEKFDELVKNPKDRLLLFEGEGFEKLIGTLEFTHRDTLHQTLPFEQARRVRMPRDTVRRAKIPSFKRNAESGLFEPDETEGLTGLTIEANKLVSHPDYYGIAAPLLWSAAILGGAFDSEFLFNLNEEEARRVGRDPGYALVKPDRLEIRPHKEMIPYFLNLGFRFDKVDYERLSEDLLTQAGLHARAKEMDLEDALMWISREEWLKIPAKLRERERIRADGRLGAMAFFVGKKEPRYSDWTWLEAAAIGLPADLRKEATRPGKELDYKLVFKEALEWRRRAFEFQRTVPPEKRAWVFQRDAASPPQYDFQRWQNGRKNRVFRRAEESRRARER